jgi:hypothetical protein
MRDRGLKRGRWLSLLVAGMVGYVLGGWHTSPSRPDDLSASQNVALRFAEAKADTTAVDAADAPPDAATSTIALKQARLALLSPQPMVPVTVPPPPAERQQAVGALPTAVTVPAPAVAAPRPDARPIALVPAHAAAPKSLPTAAATHSSRSGVLLNDAQIASIRERLHLTADQERMWPAVEAALRNIAYAKTRVAHRQSAPGTDVASLDADSVEVQGLKSAAIPLLMSFNDEQKNEVRSLAHVMGLDKLASEF